MKDTLYAKLTTGTSWEDLDKPGASPTIAKNTTVANCQQDNMTYGKARQNFEIFATMDKFLKHQIIETIGDTYIAELCKKYTGTMGIKKINLVHHLIDRYGEIIRTDLKEKKYIFNEALDTIIPVDKYVEQVGNCIQYVDDAKQP